MTSADFWRFSGESLPRLPSIQGVPARSPRVRVQSFPPSIRLIYFLHLWQFGLCLVWQTHPMQKAFYEIRVPRTGGLPLASFRFRVTPDTLALS